MHLSLEYIIPILHLRNRKILGMEILDGLRYDAQKKEWVNGKFMTLLVVDIGVLVQSCFKMES